MIPEEADPKSGKTTPLTTYTGSLERQREEPGRKRRNIHGQPPEGGGPAQGDVLEDKRTYNLTNYMLRLFLMRPL